MPSRVKRKNSESRRYKAQEKIRQNNQRLEAELVKTGTACRRGYSKVFNINLTLRTKLQILLFIAAIISLFVVGIISYDQHGFIYKLAKLLVDRERMEQVIASVGVFGPLLYIALQIIQTIISPIPGNVVGFVGGYFFGWWGVLLTEIGCLIGYYIVLALTKRFGRAFVEKLVSVDLLKKFDYLVKESGALVFFLIFLIPALPDDVVMYIAGLTKMPIQFILALAAIGRFPSVVITNQLGNSISSQNLVEAIVLAIFSLSVVGLCIWKRKVIMRLIGKDHKKYWRELCSNVKRRLKDFYRRLRVFIDKVFK